MRYDKAGGEWRFTWFELGLFAAICRHFRPDFGGFFMLALYVSAWLTYDIIRRRNK